jgi:hypothetical protein
MINLNRNSNPNEKRYKIINLYFLVCLFSIPFHLCFLFFFHFRLGLLHPVLFFFFFFCLRVVPFRLVLCFFSALLSVFLYLFSFVRFYQASVQIFGYPCMLLRLLHVWVSFRPNTHQTAERRLDRNHFLQLVNLCQPTAFVVQVEYRKENKNIYITPRNSALISLLAQCHLYCTLATYVSYTGVYSWNTCNIKSTFN